MALAGGWLVAFAITAGIANRVRPYRRRAVAAAPAPRTPAVQPELDSRMAVQEELHDYLDLRNLLAGSRRGHEPGLALAR